MNAKDIINLAAAGFTKDQIVMVMEQLEPDRPASTETGHSGMPIYNPVQPPFNAPAQPPVQSPPEPWDALIAELKGLRQEVINGNINNSQQPQTQQPTVDDILASIIAPPNKETGGNNT